MDERQRRLAQVQAKLEPWRIRATLSFAGLYQLTHELIKAAVVDEVRKFYCTGFDHNGLTYDERSYRAQVAQLSPKSKFRASLMWLVKAEAISQQQADRLDEVYAHRHDLTHELGKYLVDPDHEPNAGLFVDALHILRSIHDFWIQMEIDIGSFEEHGEVSVDNVVPAQLLLLQMCIDAYADGLVEVETSNPRPGEAAQPRTDAG